MAHQVNKLFPKQNGITEATPTYLRLMMSLPWMGGPGSAEMGVCWVPSFSPWKWAGLVRGRRKRALRRQMEANSSVGAGMAADCCGWSWASMLEEGGVASTHHDTTVKPLYCGHLGDLLFACSV